MGLFSLCVVALSLFSFSVVHAHEQYHNNIKPTDCDLPRFNAEDFVKRFQGKKIMFIGDSLSLNFWQSLVCLLHTALPQAKIVREANETISTFKLEDYELSVILYHSLYLVDIENDNIGRVLKLDSMKSGDTWKNMDVLIFNTYQWWGRKGPQKQWDYIKDGDKIYQDMDRTVAFRTGLTTWANWVDSTLNSPEQKVFFQGISPSHYHGNEWNEPGLKNCANETEPVKGSIYPGGTHPATKIVKDVLDTMKTPIYLLDVTTLSQLRKDAHPSSYNGLKGMDCTHWCIAGLPDTWSQLLYAALIQ
ncbi:Trichome birefringence-like family [Thalictrum thalictroides]|uniref:Trichome birefringence-like family n=1 Tax=Thalictrum thalictroides TaxID=46969 RepID=A0A7J6WVS5_THATH|nr:Trichome birefringence-like family [Thalictrum thalictroides]